MADRRLQVFLAVAKMGSITRAAEVLHMTQPAVTSQIKKFEDRYNVRFFDRNHDGVTLTEVGRSVYQYAERILALYDQLEATLQYYKQSESATLKLGVTPAAADYLLRRVISRFCRQHADVDVQMEICRPENMVQQLRLCQLDLAVGEQVWSGNGVRLEHAWRDPLVVIARRDHVLTRRTQISLRELARLAIFLQDPSGSIRQLLTRRAREEGIAPAHLELNADFGGLDALLEAVRSGLGVVILPASRADRAQPRNDLVMLAMEPQLEQVFYMFRSARGSEKPPLLAWFEYVRAAEQLARPAC